MPQVLHRRAGSYNIINLEVERGISPGVGITLRLGHHQAHVAAGEKSEPGWGPKEQRQADFIAEEAYRAVHIFYRMRYLAKTSKG